MSLLKQAYRLYVPTKSRAAVLVDRTTDILLALALPENQPLRGRPLKNPGRASRRERATSRYHRHKRLGLCVACDQKPVPGTVRCTRHLAKLAEYSKRYRETNQL